jgi:hypothetical protein
LAYGKGKTKDMLKRMADFGRPNMSPDLSELRARCLVGTTRMAKDFNETMSFFRKLRDGKDTGEVSDIQRDALLAMMDLVQDRFHCPEWDSEAVIQFRLDYRCIKGTKVALKNALESVGSRLQDGHPARHHIALASHTARGPAIDLDINLERSVARDIHEHQDNDRPVRLSGLATELGPETAQVRGVLARAKAEDDLSQITHVVAEDFGVVNTSSLVVLKLPKPVDPASLPDTGMKRPGFTGG